MPSSTENKDSCTNYCITATKSLLKVASNFWDFKCVLLAQKNFVFEKYLVLAWIYCQSINAIWPYRSFNLKCLLLRNRARLQGLWFFKINLLLLLYHKFGVSFELDRAFMGFVEQRVDDKLFLSGCLLLLIYLCLLVWEFCYQLLNSILKVSFVHLNRACFVWCFAMKF
jgi:hypothetical protein